MANFYDEEDLKDIGRLQECERGIKSGFWQIGKICFKMQAKGHSIKEVVEEYLTLSYGHVLECIKIYIEFKDKEELVISSDVSATKLLLLMELKGQDEQIYHQVLADWEKNVEEGKTYLPERMKNSPLNKEYKNKFKFKVGEDKYKAQFFQKVLRIEDQLSFIKAELVGLTVFEDNLEKNKELFKELERKETLLKLLKDIDNLLRVIG